MPTPSFLLYHLLIRLLTTVFKETRVGDSTFIENSLGPLKKMTASLSRMTDEELIFLARTMPDLVTEVGTEPPLNLLLT